MKKTVLVLSTFFGTVGCLSDDDASTASSNEESSEIARQQFTNNVIGKTLRLGLSSGRYYCVDFTSASSCVVEFLNSDDEQEWKENATCKVEARNLMNIQKATVEVSCSGGSDECSGDKSLYTKSSLPLLIGTETTLGSGNTTMEIGVSSCGSLSGGGGGGSDANGGSAEATIGSDGALDYTAVVGSSFAVYYEDGDATNCVKMDPCERTDSAGANTTPDECSLKAAEADGVWRLALQPGGGPLNVDLVVMGADQPDPTATEFERDDGSQKIEIANICPI